MSEPFKIYDYLPFWNREEQEFKNLIGDLSRVEFAIITNINDLNTGSIHNAIYWHKRFAERAVYETNILNSTGVMLEWWGNITNIPKPYPMTDPQYAQYIVDTINAETITFPDAYGIFPGFPLRMSPNYPCWADQCFADVGVLSPTNPNYHKSADVSHWNDAVYVYMSNISQFTQAMRARLIQGVAAGTGIYIGIY